MRRPQADGTGETASSPTRLFVTDYDGTLLTDRRTIRSRDLETLGHLRRAGVVTVIATGRSLFSFQRSLETMGLSTADLFVDYLVFSTGAGIMDLNSGRLIRSLDLAAVDVSRACAYFDGLEMDYMVHRPIPDTPHFLYRRHGQPNPDFEARIALYPGFGRPLKGQLFSRATEVLAIVPGGGLNLSRDRVQQALEGTSVIFATSPIDGRSLWIEVFHGGVSKSMAVAWLCERLEAVAEGVTAVGNDYNDQDLLQWSGTACLVENGPDALEEGCVRVRSNNRCGVTHAAVLAGLLT